MKKLAHSLLVIVAMASAGTAVASPWANAAPPRASATDTGVTRKTVNYEVPDVKVVRTDGQTVSLAAELNDGRPIVMSFIFTTCTTICPLSSLTFEKLQDLLGPDRKRVHMVSISIDPEEDTPQRLTAYAKGYKAGPDWSFYTGAMEAIIKAQKAFGVYRGDKMNHTPVTLMRPAPGKPWIRIDGFATPEDLLREVKGMVAASH